jgi:hypothetical protein
VFTVVHQQQAGALAQEADQPVLDGAAAVRHAERVGEGLRQVRGVGDAGQADQPHPVAVPVGDPGGGLDGHAGLAGAARPGQRHQPVAPKQVTDLVQLAAAPDERGQPGRQVVLRGRPDPGRRVQLAVQPLLHRVPGGEVLQLGDQLGVLAEQQTQSVAFLGGCHPQRGQPVDLRPGPVLPGELGQRVAPPQRQALVIKGDRLHRRVLIRATPRLLHQPDEPVRIHPLRVDVGDIPGTASGHQRLRKAGIGQHLPQPGDASLQGVRCVARQVLTPQRVHQGARRNHPARVQQQQLENRPLPARRQRSDAAVHDQVERTKDAELHDPSRNR